MLKQKNQLRIGAILSYINMGIGTLIPMFYTPVMLRLLGQEEYGLYRLSSSVTSYLSLISFGIGSAIVRYLTKYRFENDKEGEENMLGLFNIIFAVIALIALAVGSILALNVGLVYSGSLTVENLEKMRLLVFLMTINTSLSFLFTPYNSVVTCHERFIFLQCINILCTVLLPLANLAVLFLGYTSIGMACSGIVINISTMVAYQFYVRRSIGIRASYRKMPIHLLKEVLVFSFWVFMANLVNQLYNSTDTLIIGAIPELATVGVAVYNVGATFSNLMGNFSVGILSVLTPKVNQLVFTRNDPAELTDLMIRIGRIQCYIITLVCSGFIVFGKQFITLWAGDGYQDAYWVAIMTMIPGCIPLIQNVALNVIVAQNRHRFRSLVYLLIAAVNVAGTLFCVRSYGIVGAAFVTGIALIFGPGILMNWYYLKKIHLDIPRFWKNTLNLFAVPAVLCISSKLVYKAIPLSNWLTLLIAIILYTILYVALSWRFTMNEYEKKIFSEPVNKLLKKAG